MVWLLGLVSSYTMDGFIMKRTEQPAREPSRGQFRRGMEGRVGRKFREFSGPDKDDNQ
jgi:hypothetical protein